MRCTSAATWLQAAHVAEHVALTATTLLTGEAIGLTTAFGAVPPGPAGTALRVWAHFAINLGLTLYALRGLRRLRRSDDLRN